MSRLGPKLKYAALWYYQNFLSGFCYYWPLLILLLLPLALMAGMLLADFGPRYLFFHDSPLKGLVVGMTVVFYYAQALMVSYLIWLRDLREVLPGSPSSSPTPAERLSALGPVAEQVPPAAETPLVEAKAVLHVALAEDKVAPVAETPRAEGPEALDPLRPVAFWRYAVGILLSLSLTGLAVVGIILLGGLLLKVLPVVSLKEPSPSAPAASSAWPELNKSLPVLGGGLLAGAILWLLGRWLREPMKRWAEGVIAWLGQKGPAQPTEQRPPAHPLSIPAVPAWALFLVWALLVGTFLRDSTKDWQYWGPLFIVFCGALATVGALGLRTSAPLFWVGALANLSLAYAAITWCVSNTKLGILAGALAAAACALVLGATLRARFPDRWARGWRVLARPLEQMRGIEPGYAGWGLACLAFPLALLVVLLIRPISSPVPLAFCAFSGFVAFYGLFAYVVRRHFVLLVGGLLLAALFSNLQPYKLRFAPLRDADNDYTPEALLGHLFGPGTSTTIAASDNYYTTEDILDLQKAGDEELARQRDFDAKLKAYAESEPDDKEEATAALKKAWRKMERENRLRAGRISTRVTTGLGLDPADLQKLLGPPGQSATGLLRTEALVRSPGASLIGGKKSDLIVIVVSGGGIRSAVWTFVVLSELEQAFATAGVDFPAHVRLITGASGGMVGAAYYVCTLPKPGLRPPQLAGEADRDRRFGDLQNQRAWLSSDFLTPLVRRAVLTDLPGSLSPWPARYDRGQALEEAWGRHLKDPGDPENATGALDQTFADLRDGEQKGWRPSLVFSPMLIEDGRRVLISNLDLRYPVSNDGMLLGADESRPFSDVHSFEALELFRMFPGGPGRKGAQATMTVGTAARMSASFPYFSPAVSLPTRPRRRVVDAGYYDNYGVGLAASWLFNGPSQEWVRDQFDRILFIQVRDSVTEEARHLEKVPPDASSPLTRSLEGLTSPPEGLYNAGFASSSFRNDRQLSLLTQFTDLSRTRRRLEKNFRHFSRDAPALKERLDLLKRAKDNNADASDPDPLQRALAPALSPGTEVGNAKFVVVSFELGTTASTSWYLADREKKAIADRKDEDLKVKIQKVVDWWKEK